MLDNLEEKNILHTETPIESLLLNHLGKHVIYGYNFLFKKI